ncbi:type IX secretion/gliding motility protein PorT/SprT [Mucilaginibacter myungsuensis]|uniref:Outer membrane beta-barrel protein n=1 Tax=Mucilaginibacter myungsuensis TaxID=649104 RepID=A0A929KUJ6_9SPHI|nr:outer membrane beta-barrel protein [Mucilaginibacter myungsuensis]MBE9661841.1 outer membrane beta-barrel protein [Mucilaginibacter myungsuensis]MDN3599725.1 outer membrane beta-barrel protein [Mucilaginibacter myungsuensis]
MIKYRYLLAFVLLLTGKTLFAQGVVQLWAQGADQRDWSAGFTFQYLNTSLKIDKKPDWRAPFYDPQTGDLLTDSLNGIRSPRSNGFGVGFIGRYRLNEHLEGRITPTLVFIDRLIDYEYKSASGNPLLGNLNGSTILQQQIQTTMMDIPLSLKIKSDRMGNFRAYMLGGVKYSMLIGKPKDDSKSSPIDKLIKNSRGFASYEAGLGFDFYFEFFKLSPEFKISNSFKNVLVADNTPYSRPIDRMFLNTFMFSLYFE